ncbi:MAG: hypothetical protein ACRC80_27200, partial [Waterburya sp.]
LIFLSIMGVKVTPSDNKTIFSSNQLQQSLIRQSSQHSLLLIVFTLPVWLIAEKLIVEKFVQDWQNQKKILATVADKKTETATIPNSMLRMTREGICLNYIPTKEANSFVIKEEIINKNITEFLAPQIALQFIKSAQLSLKFGLTHFYRFSIQLDHGGQKYYEARIIAIGTTEVLIMIRDLDGFEKALVKSSQLSSLEQNNSLRLLNESELAELKKSTLIDDLEELNYDLKVDFKGNYNSCGSKLWRC